MTQTQMIDYLRNTAAAFRRREGSPSNNLLALVTELERKARKMEGGLRAARQGLGLPLEEDDKMFVETRDKVLAAVHHLTGVAPAEVLSESRTRRICLARHAAIQAFKSVAQQATLMQIGRLFDRHHSTVLGSLDQPEALTVRVLEVLG